MESTTPSASAVNRYWLTPYNSATGKNTIDVVHVAASTASCNLRSAFLRRHSGGSPISMCRKMFSSTTTELSIKRENASASPPSTIVLIVPPIPFTNQKSRQCRERNRQQHRDRRSQDCPRNSRIISAGQHQPDPAFLEHVLQRQS